MDPEYAFALDHDAKERAKADREMRERMATILRYGGDEVMLKAALLARRREDARRDRELTELIERTCRRWNR